MGAAQLTSLLSDLQSYLKPGTSNALSRAAAPSRTTSPATASSDTDTASTSEETADLDSIVYSSRFERLSVSLQYQELASRTNDDGTTIASARQLQFDFAVELRSQQLAAFSQRTRTAANGVQEAQRDRFLAAGRTMSARFSFSATLSGEALDDFAGAAEGLLSSGDADLDTFMALMEKLFSKDDDTLGDGMKMIRHLLRGSSDPEKDLKKLLDDFSKLGQAKADGSSVQSVQVSFQMEFEFEETAFFAETGQVQQCDPLVLDLDSDGIELTDHTTGADFDIRGAGTANRTAFVCGGDAFLAVDRNGNGRIDDGRELFGDQNGARNGFEELRKYDSNGDNVINDQDADFGSLRLFRDNGNGITESGELLTLAQAGIRDIQLGYRDINAAASGGNRLAQAALYTRRDGSRGLAADALLNFLA